MKIAICHPDANLLDAVRQFLTARGHRANVSENPDDLLYWADIGMLDAVVVDYETAANPDFRSELARVMGDRRQYAFIVIGPDGDMRAVIHALTYADDYMRSPVHGSELLARLEAVVRRLRDWTLYRTNKQSFGALTIDIQSQVVCYGGSELALRPQEWAVLETLMLRRPRVLSKADIMAAIHTDESALDRDHKIIDVCICHIRSKLKAAGCEDPGAVIATVWSRGYRFALEETPDHGAEVAPNFDGRASAVEAAA